MSPEQEAARLHIVIPRAMQAAVVKAAAREALRTGIHVSASEWVREAIQEKLDRG